MQYSPRMLMSSFLLRPCPQRTTRYARVKENRRRTSALTLTYLTVLAPPSLRAFPSRLLQPVRDLDGASNLVSVYSYRFCRCTKEK
ncbi:hypothetical protein NDU88_007233 [Pleurodeles waltl]|uniref:Uncharacterized protein n=1 Tax=Pleurodeles waltl TaxID=8319 RepID=A0AAV7NVD6_PLEWA|nr:hypothetical protein NDU88_007233 [Pleurodeles waltl]